MEHEPSFVAKNDRLSRIGWQFISDGVIGVKTLYFSLGERLPLSEHHLVKLEYWAAIINILQVVHDLYDLYFVPLVFFNVIEKLSLFFFVVSFEKWL